MPSTVKHYVHRVGRTARAGRSGRSVSLVGESERKILKEVVKSAKSSVKARVLPPGTNDNTDLMFYCDSPVRFSTGMIFVFVSSQVLS